VSGEFLTAIAAGRCHSTVSKGCVALEPARREERATAAGESHQLISFRRGHSSPRGGNADPDGVEPSRRARRCRSRGSQPRRVRPPGAEPHWQSQRDHPLPSHYHHVPPGVPRRTDGGEGGRALPLRLPHLPARIRSYRSICFSAIAVWVNRLATRLGSLGTTLGLA
jgi:hypothetical protein